MLGAADNITDTLHETFTHVIDWGDGTVDAVHTYADSLHTRCHDHADSTRTARRQNFTVPQAVLTAREC